jgi:hypothetical protein
MMMFGSQQNQLFKLVSRAQLLRKLWKMQLSSASLNFAKGFLHKQISRKFCHKIHAKSQEGSLTKKRADSKKSNNMCKTFVTHKSKQLQCSMEVYILKQ